MQSKITVIVPVYQVEKYIERCIISLVEQSDRDFEVIFVDDGSRDASASICQSYCDREAAFTLIHKENGGLSSARNAGLAMVQTPYVMFLDADDWLDTDTIAHLNALLRRYDADILSFRNILTKTQDRICNAKEEIYTVDGRGAFLSMLQQGDITSYSTDKVFKKALFEDHHIAFPHGRSYEDLAIVYKLLLSANQVVVSNQILYYYNIANVESITATFSVRKMQDFFCFSKEIYKEAMQNEGSERQRESGERYLVNALIYLAFKLYENYQTAAHCALAREVMDMLRIHSLPIAALSGYREQKKYILYRVGLMPCAIAVMKIRNIIRNILWKK